MRLCSEVPRRRRQFLGTAAMDARSAPIKARCYLARAVAGDKRPACRSGQDQQLPAATAYARIGWALLFAISETSSECAVSRCDSLYRNVQANPAQATGRSKRAAESQLLDSSAIAVAI